MSTDTLMGANGRHVAYFGKRRLFEWISTVRRGAGPPWAGPILSEYRGQGELCFMDDYRQRLRKGTDDGRVSAEFGVGATEEVVARCRVLRHLPYADAVRRADAMCGTLAQLVQKEGIGIVVGMMVDFFTLDLLERLVVREGGAFAGLVGSVLVPQSMVFSSRGEHRPVRSVGDEEVEAGLARVKAKAFAPFVRYDPNAGRLKFAKVWARERIREHGLALVRMLPAYQEVPQLAMTGEFVPDIAVRWRDYGVVRLADAEWHRRLAAAPTGRRMFMALHVHPEASTDYWVRHDHRLIDFERVTINAVDSLTRAGWLVLVKDHPNMFAYRKQAFMQRLLAHPGVVLVPSHVPAQHLIMECDATFTFQGTVGLQSALMGKRSVVVGQPYYYLPGRFLPLMSLAEVENVGARLDQFAVAGDVVENQRMIMRHCLEAVVPGDALRHVSFHGTADDVAAALQVGRSVAEWFPRLLSSEPRSGSPAARLVPSRRG